MYEYFIGKDGVFDTPLTATVFSLILVGFMLIETRFKIRAPQGAKRESARTFLPLAVAIPISLLAPLVCGFFQLGVIRGELRSVWVALGLILMAGGRLLRTWAQMQMRHLYIGEAAVQPGHRVVDTGPYRWIRHPGYVGGTLAAVGIGLALSSWLGALLAGVVLVIAYAIRIPREEALLAQEMGEAYLSYMARTKRFVPFLF
ncbi:MAG: isoprenylcysteine carboxylmethyltransferase family protein [Anaerolineae bacterium]|nr:isoprenylcysteine carboxylmethyltransferase family protein [Thermoflexales bacterium]MDW8407241.1 isoprenylcysteine carboxylmethyltransferase family protein [Anaerolineae bacterium]